MDHVVYLDYKAKELEKLMNGNKTMIIRGAAGRKMPYGRVNVNDTLYFINNNGEGIIKAKASVKNVFNSDKLSKDESIMLIENNKSELDLNKTQEKRWGGKRYLVLITVDGFETLEPFKINRSDYGNMDDWLLVKNIENVK